jgi:predicted nucleotidyltransferase
VRTLAEASLNEIERRVLERFAEALRSEFGERLRSVWLYGSRARGEQPGRDSDVDLLVVAADTDWHDQDRVFALVNEAAEAEGGNPVLFSAHLYTPERLAQRREIRSFFVEEVDRDRIVLTGDP